MILHMAPLWVAASKKPCVSSFYSQIYDLYTCCIKDIILAIVIFLVIKGSCIIKNDVLKLITQSGQMEKCQKPFALYNYSLKGPVCKILWHPAVLLQITTNRTPLVSLCLTAATKNVKVIATAVHVDAMAGSSLKVCYTF